MSSILHRRKAINEWARDKAGREPGTSAPMEYQRQHEGTPAPAEYPRASVRAAAAERAAEEAAAAERAAAEAEAAAQVAQ